MSKRNLASLAVLAVLGFPLSFYAGTHYQKGQQQQELLELSNNSHRPQSGALTTSATIDIESENHFSSLDAKSNQDEIVKLRESIKGLEAQLAAFKQEAEEKEPQSLASHVQSDMYDSDEEGNDQVEEEGSTRAHGEVPLTDLMSETYATVVSSLGEKYVDVVKEMHAEEVDYDWGDNMEQQIRDYIVMHDQAPSVTIDSVMCKASGCEIRVIERQEDTYDVIKKDLENQDWWQFAFVITLNTFVTDKGTHSYTLARKEQF